MRRLYLPPLTNALSQMAATTLSDVAKVRREAIANVQENMSAILGVGLPGDMNALEDAFASMTVGTSGTSGGS